jgi:two-component system chemotaxis response regulator CheY
MFARPEYLASRFAKLKVLIVEDQHYMRKVIRTMLATIGVLEVQEACNGAEGLHAVSQLAPDVILVDWDMPILNGLEFIGMIRGPTNNLCPQIPVIMLTGHGDRWRVVEAARMGVHEFLLKPVSTRALQDRLVGIICRPRPMMNLQDKLVPAPRRLAVID